MVWFSRGAYILLLGVLSDTHDNLECVDVIKRKFRELGVSSIVHLGDFTSPFTLARVFEGFKNKGYCVLGNNDGDRILMKEVAGKLGVILKDYPYVVNIGGRSILLMHGFGSPDNTIKIARALALSGVFDVVLYGHTHEAVIEKTSTTLLLNPGEASGVLSGKKTIAVIDLESLNAEIIEL